MSSSPFVFPHGDGCQALHDMSVQARRAGKENPASVLESVKPLVPEWAQIDEGGWTCPPDLHNREWRSPTVTTVMPQGRRMGMHIIETRGVTDEIDLYKYTAPFYFIYIDGARISQRRYPDNISTTSGASQAYSYAYSYTTAKQGPITVQMLITALNPKDVPGFLPSAQVRDIGITITTIWF